MRRGKWTKAAVISLTTAVIVILAVFTVLYTKSPPAVTPLVYASSYLEAKYPGRSFVFSDSTGIGVPSGTLYRFADEETGTADAGTTQDEKFPFIILVGYDEHGDYAASDDYYLTYIREELALYLTHFLKANDIPCGSVLVDPSSMGDIRADAGLTVDDFTSGKVFLPISVSVYLDGANITDGQAAMRRAAAALKRSSLPGVYDVYLERDGVITAEVRVVVDME